MKQLLYIQLSKEDLLLLRLTLFFSQHSKLHLYFCWLQLYRASFLRYRSCLPTLIYKLLKNNVSYPQITTVSTITVVTIVNTIVINLENNVGSIDGVINFLAWLYDDGNDQINVAEKAHSVVMCGMFMEMEMEMVLVRGQIGFN